MREIVFLLEEESARAMLEGVLPKIVPDDIFVRYITFDGKQDLEKQIPRKIRSYQNAKARFIVMRDQDSHPDCVALKERLVELCKAAGRPDAVIRIACRELESYYLADLAAVEHALGIPGLSGQQNKKKFRAPDYLGSPSKELSALTKGRYQKINDSRRIGPYLNLENTRSTSFSALIAGIRRLVSAFSATTANST